MPRDSGLLSYPVTMENIESGLAISSLVIMLKHGKEQIADRFRTKQWLNKDNIKKGLPFQVALPHLLALIVRDQLRMLKPFGFKTQTH